MKKIFFVLFFLPFLIFSQNDGAKKNGYIRKKDDKTNRVLYEGTFKDDKPVGRFKYYYPNDSIRALVDFRNDGKTAYARLFHLSGKRMAEGRYINREIRDSTWTFYDEAGKLLSRDKFVNGKKDGQSLVYLPDGALASEKNFKNDVQHGPFKDYFDGKAVRAQGNYLNGNLDGRVSYYYPNGIEVAAGFYKNGVKNGPWIYRTENGKVKEKELYKNGVLASQKETEAFFSKNKTVEVMPPSPIPAKTGTKKPKSQKKP